MIMINKISKELPLEMGSTKYSPCPLLTKGAWKPESVSALDRCPFEQNHFEQGRPKINVLCPFGFWGFNHVIEYVPSMPKDRPLPLWIKRAHDKPQLVMGISLDLDQKLTDAHKSMLQRQLFALQLIPKDSLADLKAALAKRSPRSGGNGASAVRITGYQLRTLLGLPSRWDLRALLNERQIDMYTVEDFEQNLATIEEFRKKRKP